MADQKKPIVYDEKTIQTLDALEHIRLRTGMYIGRIGDGSNPADGIYVMLKEVIDNAVDEYIMGHGRKIEIKRNGPEMTVRDYGRGIPLGKVIDCVSKINTGGKYNDDVFQFSVGLNGVGNKAVNALSSDFEVISYRENKFKRGLFSRGKKIEEKGGKENGARNGTYIRFVPDPEIFGDYGWQDEYLEHRLRYYAFLNSGLTLDYNGEKYSSKNGLADLLAYELGGEPAVYDAMHCKLDRLEFAFTHTHAYGETYFSFVNGQYTNDGGTHQSAFREGLLKGVNEFAKNGFAGEDVRDGLVGAVAVPAGHTLYLEDPLASRNPTSGMLYAVVDGPGAVVSSRTYNLDPQGASFGQGIPGVLATGQSAPSSLLLPLVHSAPGRFRTNLGLVQTSSGSFTVRVSIHAPGGALLAAANFTVSTGFRQINDLFEELGLGSLSVEGAWIEVQLMSPAPAFWTSYASVVDDRTNDPTYVLPVEP